MRDVRCGIRGPGGACCTAIPHPVSRIPHLLLCAVASFALSGCVSRSISRFAEDLGRAVAAHDDPELVRAALPAYLLLVDGMIERSPKSPDLLETGCSLYTAYAGLVAGDAARSAKLSERAMAYAQSAWLHRHRKSFSLRTCRFDAFRAELAALNRKHVHSLYTLGSAWAGWIRAHPEAVSAAADIPRVEAVMKRIVAIDPGYRDGAPHMVLGSLGMLLPEDLGGDPEDARTHFERALVLAEGKNLMVPVLYASQYAVPAGDRPLYRRLLRAVIDAPPGPGENQLMNTIAREQAARLLREEDKAFERRVRP